MPSKNDLAKLRRENNEMRAVLEKISKRRPSKKAAARAFDLSRRDAKDMLLKLDLKPE